jgi:hypothetical protein
VNPDAPTASPTGQSQKPAFTLQAAKGCLLSSIIVLLIVVFGKLVAPRIIVELAALIVILGGLGLGIASLFGISRHGLAKILLPAMAGMVINGLLLFIFITNFWAARNKGLHPRTSPTTAGSSLSATLPQKYQNGKISFQYDSRYQIKSVVEKGQIFLQHPDSNIVITDHGQKLDARDTVEKLAAAIKDDFQQQQFKDITENEFENFEMTNFIGSKVRLEYTRPQNLRVVAEIYMISMKHSTYSFLHYYPQDQNAVAPLFFQTVLNTFSEIDGGDGIMAE